MACEMWQFVFAIFTIAHSHFSTKVACKKFNERFSTAAMKRIYHLMPNVTAMGMSDVLRDWHKTSWLFLIMLEWLNWLPYSTIPFLLFSRNETTNDVNFLSHFTWNSTLHRPIWLWVVPQVNVIHIHDNCFIKWRQLNRNCHTQVIQKFNKQMNLWMTIFV